MKNKIDLIRTIASSCVALAGLIILIVGFVYIKNEKYIALSEYIESLENMYLVVENPVAEDLPYYYEFYDHEYRPTSDVDIIEGKVYYIKNV